MLQTSICSACNTPTLSLFRACCPNTLSDMCLLQGSSDIDQLGKIFAAFGTPGEAQWSDVTRLPDYVEYQYCPPQSFRSLFPQASEDCLDLLQRMFTYDPKQRITAQQALEHRYYSPGISPDGSLQEFPALLCSFHDQLQQHL